MNTIEDIFIKFEGTGAVAKSIGVKHSTASEMRRRGSIPVKYWPALVDAARARSIELDNDTLVRVHAQPEAAE